MHIHFLAHVLPFSRQICLKAINGIALKYFAAWKMILFNFVYIFFFVAPSSAVNQVEEISTFEKREAVENPGKNHSKSTNKMSLVVIEIEHRNRNRAPARDSSLVNMIIILDKVGNTALSRPESSRKDSKH